MHDAIAGGESPPSQATSAAPHRTCRMTVGVDRLDRRALLDKLLHDADASASSRQVQRGLLSRQPVAGVGPGPCGEAARARAERGRKQKRESVERFEFWARLFAPYTSLLHTCVARPARYIIIPLPILSFPLSFPTWCWPSPVRRFTSAPLSSSTGTSAPRLCRQV